METPFETDDIEEPEAGEAAVGGVNPVSMAMDAAARSRNKSVTAKAAALLEEQTAVLRVQREHLHEQRQLLMSHLRWRRFSDRTRAAMQVVGAFIGLVVAVGLGGTVWDASRSNAVVVEAFQSPPTLAARGLNGTVVAAGLLDELQRLQAATRTAAAKRGAKDAWSGDIKVDVPETGVSIGEVVRYLHAWLGHETHVGGDLVQTDAGLRLTIRGDGFEAKSFEGPAQDLPKLLTTAAEYVYGEAEPYLAASYLDSHGRDAETITLVQGKYAAAKPADRPFLLNAWGNALLDLSRYPEALAMFQEAVRQKPDYWVAQNNVMAVLTALGREEDVWRVGADMARVAGRGQPGQKAPELYFQNADVLTWNLPILRAEWIADMESHGGVGTGLAQEGPSIADVAARMHDPAAAELALKTSIDAGKDPYAIAMTHFSRGFTALDLGDWARAGAEMEAFAVADSDPSVRNEVTGYDCWIAPAEEMAGHPDKADAEIKAGGRYVDCYRFRADILDHRGDWPGARKAYAAAVALAPDLPAAYYSWGLALARHGDLNGAVARFVQANARGPHWADPLKAWGDALATQGRWPEAAAKYAQAAPFAPKWRALHVAWGRALQHQGAYHDAIAQYRAAV